ncbi:hypothetical protein [Dactylosporangium sp. CA-139066]|uniref:hypothetical protein n=1 Tax=Dactylosporangium sp. CA-139066 TaxID=3239930 RepID=UPI003D8FABDE
MIENPLQLLREDAAPGTALTPERLLAAGRGRVRRRRAAITGGVAAAVLVATVGVAAFAAPGPTPRPPLAPSPRPAASLPTGSLPAEPDCRSSSLTVPGGGAIERVVVDPTGSWAAGLRADHRGVVIWHDGEVSSTVADVDVTALAGISSGGVAAGTGPGPRALTFTGTHATALTPPGGSSSTQAFDINGAGDVVGAYGTPGGGQQAVEWRRSDPLHPRTLAVPAGESAAALVIADDGTIGGYLGAATGRHRAHVWPADGPGRTLDPSTDPQTDTAIDGLGGGYAFDLGRTKGLPPPDRLPGMTPAPQVERWPLTPGSEDPVVLLLQPDDGGQDAAADGTLLINEGERAVLERLHASTELPRPAGFTSVRATSLNRNASVVGGVADGGPLLWRCGKG